MYFNRKKCYVKALVFFASVLQPWIFRSCLQNWRGDKVERQWSCGEETCSSAANSAFTHQQGCSSNVKLSLIKGISKNTLSFNKLTQRLPYLHNVRRGGCRCGQSRCSCTVRVTTNYRHYDVVNAFQSSKVYI